MPVGFCSERILLFSADRVHKWSTRDNTCVMWLSACFRCSSLLGFTLPFGQITEAVIYSTKPPNNNKFSPLTVYKGGLLGIQSL